MPIVKKYIDQWAIGGRVIVLPHIEFSESYSTEKLLEMAHGIKDLFQDDVNVVIHERGPVCEVDGSWCICLRFDFPHTEEEKKRKSLEGFRYKLPEYWYMIRRDNHWGKSYGCPMYDFDRMRPLGGRSKDPRKMFERKEHLYHPDTYLKLEEHLLSLGGSKVYRFPT